MATLKDQLNSDVKTALKAGNKSELITLRMILAAIKQIEVDTRVTPDEPTLVGLLTKLCSQRRDSIAQFDAAKRQDLVDKERSELAIVERYLPTQLGADEVAVLIERALQSCGAMQMKDMGKVMNELRPQLVGRADLSAVSATVKARLTGTQN